MMEASNGHERSFSLLAGILLLPTAIMLVHPPSARADRIDIDDPSELGSLVFRENFGTDVFNNSKIADVRYAAGIYSYIYAIQTSPHFPGSGDDNELLSFAVRGHSLEETWGAIRHTDPTWSDGFLNPPPPPSRASRRLSMVSLLFPDRIPTALGRRSPCSRPSRPHNTAF